MPTHDIGCILTVYRRPHTLKDQIAAVLGQTVKPTKTLLFINDPESSTIKVPWDVIKDSGLPFIYNSRNTGVWTRFLAGFQLDCKYTSVFDDDTIPGSRWFENCLDQFHQHKRIGVLGATGVVFQDGSRNSAKAAGGWKDPNQELMDVDIVGHAWVFWSRLLRDFVELYSETTHHETAGEDYAIAWCAQRHALRTAVPPHPADCLEMWGSIKGDLGTDEVALYVTPGEDIKKQQEHELFVNEHGWKPMFRKQHEQMTMIGDHHSVENVRVKRRKVPWEKQADYEEKQRDKEEVNNYWAISSAGYELREYITDMSVEVLQRIEDLHLVAHDIHSLLVGKSYETKKSTSRKTKRKA